MTPEQSVTATQSMGIPITPVVFCFDENYAPYTAVATWSILKNCQDSVEIVWCVRQDDLSVASSWKNSIPSRQDEILIIPVDDGLFADWREDFHITRAAYMRLLIPSILHAERALYLDGDLIVTNSIGELLSTPLDNAWLAGVPNKNAEGMPPATPICEDYYLNSGVLLMNLTLMRQNDFLGRCIEVQQKYVDRIQWHDQDIINKAAENQKLVLPDSWNTQVWSQSTSAKKWSDMLLDKVNIIHFLGPVKPWQDWCNPVISSYWRKLAEEVGINRDFYKPVKTVREALLLSAALDLNGAFQEAAALKERIVARLIEMTPPDKLKDVRVSFGLNDKTRADDPTKQKP